MKRINYAKALLLTMLAVLLVPSSSSAQVKRSDLFGTYDGLHLTKTIDGNQENIELRFTLGDDGSFSIVNLHYIIFADGTRMYFQYKNEGAWIYLSDTQKIIFAFAEGKEKTTLINLKKKNGKEYSEKAKKKFMESSQFKKYFKTVDFYSDGIVVKSVSDKKLVADLENLPNCTWEKGSPYINIRANDPRLREMIKDKYGY